MDTIEKHYKVNIYLLSAIGLWPYTSKKIRKIQNIVVSFILWVGVSSQVLTFVTVDYTMDLFVKTVPNIIMALGYTLKYNSFLFEMETVKNLMEQIKNDWNSLNGEAELAIIRKHIQIGQNYTQTLAREKYAMNQLAGFDEYTGYEEMARFCVMADIPFMRKNMLFYSAVLGVLLVHLLPEFLNVVIPLNESRPHKILYTAVLFFDQQKYFYSFVLTVFIVVLLGAMTFNATEGIYFVWSQHAASMYEIVSYRIRETVAANPTKKELYNGKSDVRTFRNAMEGHKRVSKFYEYMKRKFLPWYLLLALLGIVSLSFNLFRFTQLFHGLTDIDELLITGTFLMGEFAYMFYCNYVIQQVLDSSSQIIQESYNSTWYKAPMDMQKQLLFIMLCNVKCLSFNMYGLYNFSIEGFGTLIRISVSYFMILHSMQ